jgi:hypothetical protein
VDHRRFQDTTPCRPGGRKKGDKTEEHRPECYAASLACRTFARIARERLTLSSARPVSAFPGLRQA